MSLDKRGYRTVELLQPFEYTGRKVEQITFEPVKFDHTLRWQAGLIRGPLALMSLLCGLEEQVLRELTYPDVDRIFDQFLDHLPRAIRDDVAAGTVPPPPEQEYTEPQPQQANGRDVPVTPITDNPEFPYPPMPADYPTPPTKSAKQPINPIPPMPPPRPEESGTGFDLE